MKITIDDFQSIEHATLDARGLTVIVGPSNYGKSAVLRAVEGLLFNRPGEHVVRKGAPMTRVEVEHLPGTTQGVRWVKGKNTNKYLIGGVEYGRVGADAPEPLQTAGYRDVWVGDADRKRGESIRPQVATQFEPLFLLTRSGSFLADVLGLLSRHAVVATAQDRCASDLRSTKQQVGVLTTQLGAVDEKLKALTSQSVMADGDFAWMEALLAAIEAHQTAVARIARRRELKALPYKSAGPDVSTVPLGRAEKVGALRTLVTRRRHAQSMPTALPEAPPVDPEAIRGRASVGAGVRKRRLLAALVARAVRPVEVAVVTGPVAQLRAHVTERRAAMDLVFRTQQAARGAADLVEEAERELAEALARLEVCPTCQRPMALSKVGG